MHSTVSDAARKRSVSEATIAGILDRGVVRPVDWGAWGRREVIGLDEIARQRGHRAGVVLVTPPLTGGSVALVAVLGDRTQESVAAFRRAIPAGLRCTIQHAGTEMEAGFVRAIAVEVPGAEVVIDRFHGAWA
jgi:transposase